MSFSVGLTGIEKAVTSVYHFISLFLFLECVQDALKREQEAVTYPFQWLIFGRVWV